MINRRFKTLLAAIIVPVALQSGIPATANAGSISGLQAVATAGAAEKTQADKETDKSNLKKSASGAVFIQVMNALSDLMDKDRKTKEAITRNIKG